MRMKEPLVWVVYRMEPIKGSGDRIAVCSQTEWHEIAATHATGYTLVQANIMNEGEAEQIARKMQTPLEIPKRNRPVAKPRVLVPTEPEATV